MAARTRSYSTPFATTGDLHQKVTVDNPTPNYKALVAAGRLFCKDYSSIAYDVAGPPIATVGYHVWHLSGGRRIIDAGLLTSPASRAVTTESRWNSPTTSSWLSTFYAKTGTSSSQFVNPTSHEWAVKHTELSAAMNTGISSILVSGAEMGKTIKMINRALVLLRRPLIDAKKALQLTRAQIKTTSGRKKLLEKAEELWLEGRYGWRPFIYDVMSWVDASKSKYSERRTVKDALNRVTGGPTVESTVLRYAAPGIQSERIRTWHLDFIASCGQTADFGLNLSQFARVWGALDVVGTAWDLVKFSFVCDWFFNLGDTLKALQVYALIDERVGWNKISLQASVKTLWKMPAIGIYGNREVDYHLGNRQFTECIERVTQIQRFAVSDFMPSLGFSFDIDCAKTLDLLALLHQLVKGTRPN